MTEQEIVRATRWLARDTEFVFAAETLNEAASLIENLQAELAEFKAFHDGFAETEAKNYSELYVKCEQAQRRADAAVEDIEGILRCNQNCGVCKFNGGAEQCEKTNGMCQGKWRGLEDGEESR